MNKNPILKLREERDLTQEAFAKMIGIYRQALSDIEQGRVFLPRESTLKRIAFIFDLNVYDLAVSYLNWRHSLSGTFNT